MIEGDPHGGGVFCLLGFHRVGVVESAATMTPVDSIHRSLELVATDLCRLDKKGRGVALAVFEPRAENTHFGGVGDIPGARFPEAVEKFPEGNIILSGEAGGFRLPAQFKAEFDLYKEVSGKVVHRAETPAGFLKHTMERRMSAGEAAQSGG